MSLASWTDQQIQSQLASSYRWTGSTITYAFPSASSGIYGATERVGFQALTPSQQYYAEYALHEWDDLIAPDLQRTTATASNIEFGFTGTGVEYAHTYSPSQGSVWFSRLYADLLNPKIGEHGFFSYLHEIGHAFGLNHMGNYNGSGDFTPSCLQDSTVYSVMSYFGPNWCGGASSPDSLVAWADWVGGDGRVHAPQTPMLYDIMALQAMYGAETTTRSGDTIYGFGCNVTGSLASIYNFTINLHPVLTIYDAGGLDTLDLSGWSTPCTIDLNPGHFSSCGSMTNNIAIAFNSEVENATGGRGADIINGNAVNNRLDGGAGNDQLFGGAGNDTLVAGAGDDLLAGGEGTDTLILAGLFSSYAVSFVNGQFTIAGQNTGTDTASGIERFQFSDTVRLASDFGVTATERPIVSVSASAASLAEGSGNATLFNFTVNLTAAAATEQRLHWSVAGAGGSPADAADFSSGTAGNLLIQPGQTSGVIQVAVAGDTVWEADESFVLTLANPSTGIELGAAVATATILNDDSRPVVQVDDYPLSASTTGVVEVGGPLVSGAIETVQDGDLFRVELEAGNTYAFTLTGRCGNLDPHLELYGPSLQGLAYNNNADGTTTAARIVYTATETATYFLGAYDWWTGVGGYSIGAALFSGLSLVGDGGGDRLEGSPVADTLAGLGGNDTLTGNAGDDQLDGGAGIDRMIGGAGNDTYLVDDRQDVVVESMAGGIDRVESSASYILANNVEQLLLTGAAAISATGNGLANVLIGNSASNLLDGKGGLDVLDGGDGADVYLIGGTVEHAAAEISDSGIAGEDEIRFAAQRASTLTLFAGDTGIERVVIGMGSGALANSSGTISLHVDAAAVGNALAISGNAGANRLVGTAYDDTLGGGAGADTLLGGAGNDWLSGGNGADLFVFGAGSNGAAGVDVVADFQTGADSIQLSRAVFTALTATADGGLSDGQFLAGSEVVAGRDGDDRLLYNTATGVLSYDPDGSGVADAVQIAILGGTTTHPALAGSDFLLA
ncbi:MAG: M10 family metallopeptidase C-terminal domain-containing protein [Thermodesulfobacteriota bacterium]